MSDGDGESVVRYQSHNTAETSSPARGMSRRLGVGRIIYRYYRVSERRTVLQSLRWAWRDVRTWPA